ncbi:alpha/beta hydrolase [Porticoccaceae bacterium]|nr:alpha/beta hydrolase [Porticoccaceae bacterium]
MKFIIIFILGTCATFLFGSESARVESGAKSKKGEIKIPSITLPISTYLSEETKQLLPSIEQHFEELGNITKDCSSPIGADIKKANTEQLSTVRNCIAEHMYTTSWYAEFSNFDVNIKPKKIAGIYTEVFTPENGVPEENKNRVLINVHGGAFTMGSRWASHIESIPIASVGKIKVISVDYRMSPKYKFPAGSEDVSAVYKMLLKDYSPKNIGIYGCSAGARITGQAVASFIKQGLPLPGAIGMHCSAPTGLGGDSNHIVWAMNGKKEPLLISDVAYFDGVEDNDPLAFPGESSEMLSQFPPSLLITSTRDYSLSPMVYVHSQLTELGVEANLHIWEGLPHGFFYHPELPESRQTYDVIVNFFSKHLGK